MTSILQADSFWRKPRKSYVQDKQKEQLMQSTLPEKARVLKRLRGGKFNVPDFIYVPASDFENEHFEVLIEFLSRHQESYKVITRSAHPQEEFFKGGTFDSLDTYADLSGIKYERNRGPNCKN